MARLEDFQCKCGHVERDVEFSGYNDFAARKGEVPCPVCGKVMDHVVAMPRIMVSAQLEYTKPSWYDDWLPDYKRKSFAVSEPPRGAVIAGHSRIESKPKEEKRDREKKEAAS